jgi:hypothetical protein
MRLPALPKRISAALLIAALLVSPAFAGKSTTFSSDLLKLIFNGTTITALADNTATSPATNLYLSLHTADPGASGTQTTSEAAYTGYARVAVARTTGGFTVTTNTVALAANQDFGPCTAGTSTVTYWGVGTSSTGTGKILYSGPVSPTIMVSAGVTPRLTTGTQITEQ